MPEPEVIARAERFGLRFHPQQGDWVTLGITNNGTKPLRFDSRTVEYEVQGQWVGVSTNGWFGVHGKVWWPGTGSLVTALRPPLVPRTARWRFHYVCALDPVSGPRRRLFELSSKLFHTETLLFLAPVQMVSSEIPVRNERQESLSAASNAVADSNGLETIVGQTSASPVTATNPVMPTEVVSIAESKNAATEPSSILVEEISENELANIGRDYLEKATWSKAGLASVEGLIESYYWAIREGNERSLSNCLSRSEQGVLGRMAEQSRRYVDEWLSGRCMANVAGYAIVSARKLDNGQTVVSLRFTMIDGSTREEHLGLVKQSGEFTIDGARGYLYYPHHAGRLPIGILQHLTAPK